MNAFTKTDMMEATRLTREGRLDEAMAVLRGAISKADVAKFDAAAPENWVRPTSVSLRKAASTTAPRDPASPPRLTEPLLTTVRSGPKNQPPDSQANLGLFGHMGSSGSLHALKHCEPSGTPAQTPPPQGAQFEEHTLTNAAGSRTYKLYVPSRYVGQALPLVVMLHGCSQSPDDFALGTRMNVLAEAQTFLVAYPAQAQSANVSRCWNWFSAEDQRRDRGEPSLIAGITRQIMREFSVRPGQVYVAGLSAGGAAAAVMGSTYPDLYAAIGVHSGLACGAAGDMPSALMVMRRGASAPVISRRRGGSGKAVPTIVFHGDRDMTVNPINGDQVIAQSKAGADFEIAVSHGASPGGIKYTRTVHTDESGRPMLEQWRLHGAGHAWSGGSRAGSYTDPRGPDASREMMRFFLQHGSSGASLD